MSDSKIIIKLKGGPADGSRFTTTAPAPDMVTVPVRLADGLGECRYYRSDETVEGMPVYEYPSAVH